MRFSRSRIRGELLSVDSYITWYKTSPKSSVSPLLRRKKLEHLMYEYVHRRSVTRGLVARRISSNKGPITYDVRYIFVIFDPLCPLSHSRNLSVLFGQPPLPLSANVTCE